jgi:L-threonylcarbamoyladenylate synthase
MASQLLDIEDAAQRLAAGAVLVYPTEAVFGLGCNPLDQAAVRRLLSIKSREAGKGLILIAASADQLAPWFVRNAVPDDAWQRVVRTWPGPHTWLLPASDTVPSWIRGDHPAVALRVSAHPVVAALCNAFGGALISTSANRSGQPAPREPLQLDPALLALCDGRVDGDCGGAVAPSSIRDALSGATLRA